MESMLLIEKIAIVGFCGTILILFIGTGLMYRKISKRINLFDRRH